MGLFGGFVSAVKSMTRKVVKKVADVIEYAVDDAIECGSAVKAKTTNMWNKFSGKDKFIEADELYEKISKKYKKHIQKFEQSVEEYTVKIEKHVNSINNCKGKIKRELFVEMAQKMVMIKDIEISHDFCIEEYITEVVTFDSVREKDKVYKIDFNKNKFKTTVLAICTLGIVTRNRAKETLMAVKEEEKKLKVEMAKMDAEIMKLQAIEKSLENIVIYFTGLIDIYENLLIRLDSSVNFLYVRCMSFAHKLVNKQMSIKKLPIMNQKELEAIVTTSKILKVMIDTQITSIKDQDQVEKYRIELSKRDQEIRKAYDAA